MRNPEGCGLVNRIKKELPHVRDPCHSLNLVIDDALKEIPVYIISFLRKTCAYFSPGQRRSHFRELQEKDEVKEPLGILSYVSIRWESLCLCTERIIKVWKYLKIYFKNEDSSLSKEIEEPEYEVFAYLLSTLLHRLTGEIVFFQKPKLLFDHAWEKFKECYTLVSRLILKKEYQETEFPEVYEILFENQQD